MKSTYVDTRSANVGDIRCLFALASDSTSNSNRLKSNRFCLLLSITLNFHFNEITGSSYAQHNLTQHNFQLILEKISKTFRYQHTLYVH